MSTVTYCDFCDEVVAKEDLVGVSAEDYGWFMLADVRDVERNSRKLDLHRDCYVVNYKASIEQRGAKEVSEEHIATRTTKANARIFAEADSAAQHVRDTAHPCAVCHESMIAWPGRLRHWGCEPGSLAGKVCTCPSGCSGSHWGDGPLRCDPACEPCRLMRGKPLRKRSG